MALKLPAIPSTTRDMPKSVVDVLNPIRSILESRVLGSDRSERVITGNDMVKLGLITTQQLQQLDDK